MNAAKVTLTDGEQASLWQALGQAFDAPPSLDGCRDVEAWISAWGAARVAEALRDAADRLRNGDDGFQHETVAPYLDELADEYDGGVS